MSNAIFEGLTNDARRKLCVVLLIYESIDGLKRARHSRLANDHAA